MAGKKVELDIFEDALTSIPTETILLCIDRFTSGQSKPKNAYYKNKWGLLQECKIQGGAIFWILFTLDSLNHITATVGYPASFNGITTERKKR